MFDKKKGADDNLSRNTVTMEMMGKGEEDSAPNL